MSEFPDGIQLGNLLLSLMLILGLIFASVWALKRLTLFTQPAGGKLKVLASLSLGARERAILVQAGDQQLLLGVAPGRVATLHVFEEPMELEPAKGQSQTVFAQQLAKFFPSNSAPGQK